MRDCSRCSNRAELNPIYLDMVFEDTPCSKCRVQEPSRSNIVSYGSQFDHPSDTTWKILDIGEPDEMSNASSDYRQYLLAPQKERSSIRAISATGTGTRSMRKLIFMFSRAEEEVLALLAQNSWDMSLSSIGRKSDTEKSKQAVHKLVKRISILSPELKSIIGGGK